MRVFMTGATGSIGFHLTRRLIEAGNEVVGLARSDASAAKLKGARASAIAGDMRSPSAWKSEAAKADVLIHLSAIQMGMRGGRGWLRTGESANEAACTGLMEAALAGGKCRAFIVTSGAFVVGDHGDQWVDEETPLRPNLLARFWLASENVAKRAAQAGIPTVVLRPGQVYAPDPAGTFGKILMKRASSGMFKYIGDGENYFPFVSLTDVLDAYIKVIDKVPAGQTFNIVDDDPVKMREFTDALVREFGHKAGGMPIWIAKIMAGSAAVAGMSASFRTRNSKARKMLAWSPTTPSIRPEIPRLVREYRALVSGKTQPALRAS